MRGTFLGLLSILAILLVMGLLAVFCGLRVTATEGPHGRTVQFEASQTPQVGAPGLPPVSHNGTQAASGESPTSALPAPPPPVAIPDKFDKIIEGNRRIEEGQKQLTGGVKLLTGEVKLLTGEVKRLDVRVGDLERDVEGLKKGAVEKSPPGHPELPKAVPVDITDHLAKMERALGDLIESNSQEVRGHLTELRAGLEQVRKWRADFERSAELNKAVVEQLAEKLAGIETRIKKLEANPAPAKQQNMISPVPQPMPDPSVRQEPAKPEPKPMPPAAGPSRPGSTSNWNSPRESQGASTVRRSVVFHGTTYSVEVPVGGYALVRCQVHGTWHVVR